MAFLERSDLIKVREDERGDVLYFEEGRRRALDIYRNSIGHFLVIPSIVARGILSRRAPRDIQEDLEAWLEVFYHEYYVARDLFHSRGEAVADYFEEIGWAIRAEERWEPTQEGISVLAALAEQTRGVIEFYDTVVRILKRDGGEGLRTQLLADAHTAFENAKILGTARRKEAATDTSFDDAMTWLASRKIIEIEHIRVGKRKQRETRYAPGEAWEEIEGVASLLASALTDR